MFTILLCLAVGFGAGVLSGLIGIGGGVITIPALVYMFKMPQHYAQGTTLAMFVLPAGILAAYTYYQQGFVNLKFAFLLALGFLAGGPLGARLAVHLPEEVLKRVFGFALLLIALKMIWGK
ncbi:MAG: sulfite exporter TauE/SafE family protein [Anaerolineae bacterium]|nr:sulfite exporter TauE/SafE family protein [Anaerolineae bacterium]MDW8101898.1 sulfite exporter TauE/SafE family protein [Anaerolineae bacterium]